MRSDRAKALNESMVHIGSHEDEQYRMDQLMAAIWTILGRLQRRMVRDGRTRLRVQRRKERNARRRPLLSLDR